MGRSMTSSVSTVSGFVANGHQTVRHVSCAPSKIPYGGFSPVRLQTGIGRRSSSPTDLYAVTVVSAVRSWVFPVSGRLRVQSEPRSASADDPVQRPLAPHWVLLSQRIFAYYGLIRASRPLLSAYFLRPAGLCPSGRVNERVPTLLCVSVPSCRLPYPGRPQRPLVTVPWPPALAFANPVEARRLLHRAHRFTRVRFRGCKVRLMLRPEELFALHRKGLLRSSFHLPSHLVEASSIATRANSQFPRPVFHRQDTQPYGLQTG